MHTNSGDGTGSLEKALDILEAVGAAPEGLSQGDITNRLRLPRTTVYRVLATLVTRGLLRRDPLRRVYCMGFRCFEMARQAYAAPDLIVAAASELRSLRDLTGETAYLATLDGLDVISLDRCDGAHSERSNAQLGQRKPIYCTSQGKAILSALPAPEREERVRELTLKALTPHTLTDRRKLQAELKISAARGWSIDNEEIVMGVRCVGAPVVDTQGKVRGAISVAGPAWRMTLERVELLGPELAEAAHRIGQQLRPPSTQPGDEAVQAVNADWSFHGAFPHWNKRTHKLVWADTLAPAVRSFDGLGVTQWALPSSPVVGMMFRGEDLIVAQQHGVLRITPDGQSAPVTMWPAGRVQALCALDDTTAWIAFEAGQQGSTVGQWNAATGRWEPMWTVDEPVQALCWEARHQQLFATAPASGTLLVMKPGGPVRRLTSVVKGSGRISGLALDPQGGLWTALCDGWSVVRISPDGQLDHVIGLPVPQPTDVAISHEAHPQLFITTARQTVPLDTLAKAPLSGHLLRVQL